MTERGGPQRIPTPEASRPGGPPPWPVPASAPPTVADVAAVLGAYDPVEIVRGPPTERPPRPGRRSAVLIALYDGPDGATTILTRRPQHMRKHAGEIAFPGGAIDADDASPWAAALREADEEVALGALVQDVAASFQPTAEMQDIALRVTVPKGRVALRFDALLLESALRNLIDNAVKYSGPDGTVQVTLAEVAGEAVITVADRGRGLGAEDGTQLARRFQRGANAADVVGSGLGLTIVRDVARAIGGSFAIQNREGGGTCATLTLPLG